MLLAVTYHALTTDPQRTLDAIYEFIGAPPFKHDFENVEFDATESIVGSGTPGLHSVGQRVAKKPRKSVLPPELIRKYENRLVLARPRRQPQ